MIRQGIALNLTLMIISLCSTSALANCRDNPAEATQPDDIVALDSIAPDIIQDMRYASSDNFLGRPVDGYEQGRCYVTLATAKALATVQTKVREQGLSLKVFDCYRPQRAVDDFMRWAAGPAASTQPLYFPNLAQTQLIPQGYIAECSGHSRASTVDLTLVKPGESGPDKRGCNGSGGGELDMGTGYDCFDPKSNTTHPDIDLRAQRRRLRLVSIMERHGFSNYPKEWWHFTLRDETYPRRYFDFPVK